ncbi:MAG: sulfite exporter TauE/SafE family protein [Bacteroidetes bacterium]|nr:sulfite exporter TauE/SafE family protein [Bacteroidota bacterium]MBM3425206.1 sulfite exporter TauE/SafE family protein [Bacteroidota bacterium]
MDWLIPLVAFLASLLTFFSGFGLGTLLMAAMLFYFPPELAIAFTALVHFANSSFKVLLNRNVDWKIVGVFGISAFVAALFGSWVLNAMSSMNAEVYDFSQTFDFLHPVKLTSCVIGILLLVFAYMEWKFKQATLTVPLWLGGLFSGFFGGLSGHQGALRSAFLANRMKEVSGWVATSAMIAWFTDLGRLSIYALAMDGTSLDWGLLAITCLAALVAVLIGSYALKKVTLKWVQTYVAIGLFLLGFSMLLGMIQG